MVIFLYGYDWKCRYVLQKINGWKIYHLAAGMEDIVDMESELSKRLQEVRIMFQMTMIKMMMFKMTMMKMMMFLMKTMKMTTMKMTTMKMMI